MIGRRLGAFTLLTLALTTGNPATANEGTPTFDVDIPVQPLDAALIEFSTQTRSQVSAESAILRGIQSHAVSGRLTAKQALTELIQNSPLVVATVNASTFALQASSATPAPSPRRDPPTVDEIIVTGTKQNRSIQDTQASVTVVTGDTIDKQALFSLDDVILRTPNVSSGGSNSLNTLTIRGVTLQGVNQASGGFAANVYVDGSPNSFDANQGANNLWDISQVEILRGPQSTVQGRNALAGAIIINTADPEYEWGAKARAIVGNENLAQGSFMVTGPIIQDQLAFRIAADYREDDFEVVNVDTGDNTRFQEALTLRGKLLIEPDAIAGLRVELIASHADTQFGQFGGANSPVPATDPAFADFDPFGNETFGFGTRFEDNTTDRFTLDVSYALNDNWTLIGIGTNEDQDRIIDFGPGSGNNSLSDTYTAELRAAFDYGRLRGWIGGYYFETSRGTNLTFNAPVSAFPFPAIPSDAIVSLEFVQNIEFENKAVFADFSFEINDRWSVGFGARYDDEGFENKGTQATATSNPPDCVVDPAVPMVGGLPCAFLLPANDEAPSSASYNAFLPRGSVIYNFSEDRSLSFTVSRGYRAGGSYIFSDATVTETRTFEPEFVTNYEFAWRSEWPEHDIVLNANLFYTDWVDQQVAVDRGPGLLDSDTLNSAESELYGLEVQVNKIFSDSLTVFGSLGLTHTEFKNFPFAVGSGTEFENLAGNDFSNAPGTNISGGFVYEHPNGFFVNGTVAYSSEQYSDVTNLVANENEDYTLVNAKAGYRWDNFEVSLFVDNLFDERFTINRGLFQVDSQTGDVNANTPGAFFTVNDPRIWGLELRTSF
ncbi:MAG: TonB-dependent receptor [Pseudomonadota bacterium]